MLYDSLSKNQKDFLCRSESMKTHLQNSLIESQCVIKWPINSNDRFCLVYKPTSDTNNGHDGLTSFWKKNICSIFEAAITKILDEAIVDIPDVLKDKIKHRFLKSENSEIQHNDDRKVIYEGVVYIVGWRESVQTTYRQLSSLVRDIEDEHNISTFVYPVRDQLVRHYIETTEILREFADDFMQLNIKVTVSGIKLVGQRLIVEKAQENLAALLSTITTKALLPSALSKMLSCSSVKSKVDSYLLESGTTSTLVQLGGIWYVTSRSEEANKKATSKILKHFKLDRKIKVHKSVSQLPQWRDICAEFVKMSTDFVSIQYVDTTLEFHINGMAIDVSEARGKIVKALNSLKSTGSLTTRMAYREIATNCKAFIKNSLQTQKELEKTMLKSNCRILWPQSVDLPLELEFYQPPESSIRVGLEYWASNIGKIFTGALKSVVNLARVPLQTNNRDSFRQRFLDGLAMHKLEVAIHESDAELEIIGRIKHVNEAYKIALSLLSDLNSVKLFLPAANIQIMKLLDVNDSLGPVKKDCKNVTIESTSTGVLILGTAAGVSKARGKVEMILTNCVVRDIHLSPTMEELIFRITNMEIIRSNFRERKLSSILAYSNTWQIVSLSKKDSEIAFNFFDSSIIHEITLKIDKTYSTFSAWHDHFHQFRGDNESDRVIIKYSSHDQQLRICGITSSATTVIDRLKALLDNWKVTEIIEPIPNNLFGILKSHNQWKEKFNKYIGSFINITLTTSTQSHCVAIKCRKGVVQEMKHIVHSLCKQVSSQTMTVTKHGIYKHFKTKQGQMDIAAISQSTKSYIETSIGQRK